MSTKKSCQGNLIGTLRINCLLSIHGNKLPYTQYLVVRTQDLEHFFFCMLFFVIKKFYYILFLFWIRPDKVLFKGRRFETVICPILNSLAENEGKRGQNKTGADNSDNYFKLFILVYVASGPKLKKQPEPKLSPQILVLVSNDLVGISQINKESQETFGRKYVHSSAISYYKTHETEQPASVLLKDFDFKNASVGEILQELQEVVSRVETRVTFVVTVPLKTWSLDRDNLVRIAEGNDKLVCVIKFV